MDRRAILLAMKDVLEHLGDCYDGWPAAEHTKSEHLLATLMKRDVDRMRQLCELLERDPANSSSGRRMAVA